MKNLIQLYEFLFDRWTYQIIEEGEEQWYHSGKPTVRSFVKYKLTNKFNPVSQKIKKVYLD